MEAKILKNANISLEEKVNNAIDMAQKMVYQGYSNGEIRMALMEYGFNYDDAESILKHVYDESPSPENKAKSNDVAVGFLWLIGGLLVTAITYSAASECGDMYIIAYGPVIYGVVRLIKGLLNK